MTPDATAVIVNWNCASMTINCVAHLQQLYPRLSIVVIDNGSKQEDVEDLTAGLPNTVALRVLANNGGYGHGVNQALLDPQLVPTRWAWLINPDSMPAPACLEELLARGDGALALSPRQVTSPDFEDPDFVVYASAATIVDGRTSPFVCQGCSRGAHDVSVVTGTGLLLDVRTFRTEGGFDESFFHYKEEFELVERMGRHGKVLLVCAARHWHQRGASLDHQSASAAYYRVRNEFLYVRRRQVRAPWDARSMRLLARTALTIAKPNTGSAVRWGLIVAAIDGMRNRGGPRVERR